MLEHGLAISGPPSIHKLELLAALTLLVLKVRFLYGTGSERRDRSARPSTPILALQKP